MPVGVRRAKSIRCVRCGRILSYSAMFVSHRGFGGSWHRIYRFCPRCAGRALDALYRLCFEVSA